DGSFQMTAQELSTLLRYDLKPIIFLINNDGYTMERDICLRLILAMPRRSLELLEQSGSVLDPENVEVHKMIKSVTPQPLLKIFRCYSNPWWQGANVSSGKSDTDLPARQCYYIGTDRDQPEADKSNRKSL